MAPSRTAWAEAFHRQSQSDWLVYKLLNDRAELAPCHRLHYLQMACEKLAKAYRIRDTAADLTELMHRHVGFVKFIRSYLLSSTMKMRYQGRLSQLQQLLKLCNQIAGAIEKLTPAIDRLDRPENAEYPWADGDRAVAPVDHAYPNLLLLRAAGGRAFLKVIAEAMRDF